MNSGVHAPDKWLAFGLAFVGGFGDAAGFLLAKTFTGHITGSLVLGAITIAARDWRGALSHFSAVAFFLAGIPLNVLIVRLTAARPSWPLRTAMGIEMILIIAAYLALAYHLAGVEIFVVCQSLALGLQNAAFRRAGGISVHTTYLTGLITGLLAKEAERHAFHVTPPPSTAPDPKFDLLYGIWGSFVLGAVTGAALVFHFKEPGILGAVLILFVIILRREVCR